METWRRLRATHKAVLVAFGGAFVAGLVASAAVSINIWTGSWGLTDRLTGVGAAAALGALYEAVIAGVLALVAYALASERPTLSVELQFRSMTVDELRAMTADASSGLAETSSTAPVRQSPYLLFSIRVGNASTFSARNPAARVELFGIRHPHWDRPIAPRYFETVRWVPVKPVGTGARVAWIWNGGVDAAIHGPNWFIDLPELDLGLPDFVSEKGAAMQMYVEAVAEGDRCTETFDLGKWLDRDPSSGAVIGRNPSIANVEPAIG